MNITAKEIIEAGVLLQNDPNPYHVGETIARFVKLRKASQFRGGVMLNDVNKPHSRRSWINETVGNIDVVSPATSSSVAYQWSVSRSTGLPTGSPIASSGPPQGNVNTYRVPTSYTYGSSGVNAINQVAQTTTTIGTSATVNFNVVTWADNVIGDASATFSAIKFWLFELLTATQYGSGATASSVTLGDHATNAWIGILSATGTYTIQAGGVWHHEDITSGGIEVTAGDLLKSVNNDASNIATIRVTAFGFK